MLRFPALLFRLHRWLGLCLGALFVLIGLSGSLTVFQGELDRVLNPSLLDAAPPSGDPVATAVVVDAVRARSHSDELLSFLSLPRNDNDVYRAYLGNSEAIFQRMVTVAPGNGEILGERPVGEGLMRFVHVLHFRLHLGRSGQTLVGIIGLFLLLSLISGTILWWRGGQPGQVHHSLGVYAGLPLLLVLITGIVLALPQYSRPAVNWFSPLSGLDLGHESEVSDGRDDIGVTAAMAMARTAMPGGEVSSIGLPRSETGSYRLSMREAEPDGWRRGSGHVVLDRYSGQVLARRHWDEQSGGDRFMGWLRPLHGGSAFGLPGRVLVALLGLLPLLLYITGIRMWLRNRASR